MQPQPPYGAPYPGQFPYPARAAGTPYQQPQPTVSNATLILIAARIAGLAAVALGLSIPFNDTCMWSTALAWSIFATLAALVALIAGLSGTSAAARLIGIGATAALLTHWVLIVLPGVGTNAGFCLTLGTGAIVAAAWFSWGKTPAR